MTTTYDRIDDLYDIAVLDRSLYRNEFRHYIEENLSNLKKYTKTYEQGIEEGLRRSKEEEGAKESCLKCGYKGYTKIGYHYCEKCGKIIPKK